MAEEKLLYHIISRLEPQLLDYVEVRHPQTTFSLLQLIAKYEEIFLNRMTRDPSHDFRSANHSVTNQFTNRNRHENSRGTKVNNRYYDISGQQRESTDLEVKVLVIIAGSIVDAEVINLIIDSIIIAVDRVVRGTVLLGVRMVKTGRVELQIRIRDIQKTWEFRILDNIQYKGILGIDFMKDSRLTLDFDKKLLVIPDEQIKPLPIVEKPVEIDISNSKHDKRQKQKFQDLFNSFQGQFSDKPGVTHVLYPEIDTGDQGLVVSRPYRYDRVKQGIIDYHIEKMLKDVQFGLFNHHTHRI
ncbi:uncharacterized protein TNCV_2717581 [Trichonephila clavipes]|nr:uncharacterized protein TNCV_2717581 [Trichonephila clavipes]